MRSEQNLGLDKDFDGGTYLAMANERSDFKVGLPPSKTFLLTEAEIDKARGGSGG